MTSENLANDENNINSKAIIIIIIRQDRMRLLVANGKIYAHMQIADAR